MMKRSLLLHNPMATLDEKFASAPIQRTEIERPIGIRYLGMGAI